MNPEKLSHKRHTLAHLLAAAVRKHHRDAKATIGPAIDNGFYYDFEFATPITEKEIEKLDKEMKKLLPKWTEFTHKEVSADEAKVFFKDNPYKLELIEEIVSRGEKIIFYECGGFIDLCRGGHLEHPATEIDPESFKLSRIAGAYWRGDEKNKMLTRIYGLAFETKEELVTYETAIEEAKKRDHKILGRELDLFTFSDLVGAGLPLWTPKGTTVRHLLDQFVWSLRGKHGYEKVEIPHITKKDLYVASGHWDKYKDDLLKVSTREGHEFVLKPMNCPHHTQIFARKQWSYRELPQRYANTTTCYRDEQTGELSGLSRTRAFAQDDAHVFCRMGDVKAEFLKIWDIINSFYPTFGFVLTPRLSRRDPSKPEGYLGSAENWDLAENTIKEILAEKGVEYIDGIGEAAFYGPKLDFMAKDSMGRPWQVATIQLDMVQPERFDLSCVNDKGEKERLVMIHAAIMGSLERFMSIYIEHVAGNFPTWLAPVQVKVVPVRDEDHSAKATETSEALKAAGLRIDLDLSPAGFGKKVRAAKDMKVPYTVIIGDKDIEAGMVTLESRDKGNLGQMKIEDVVAKLVEENTKKS